MAHLQSPHRSSVRLQQLPPDLLLLRRELIKGSLLVFHLSLDRGSLSIVHRPVSLDYAPKILDLLIAGRLRVR